MATTDDYDSRDDIGWLRDELLQRDRTNAELRGELDDANDLIRRFDEYVEDYSAALESWKQAFGMEQNDKGKWTSGPVWNKRNKLIDDYNDLVNRWNRAVPIINAGRQDVGRPLAASAAQVTNVLKLHKRGKSLRFIADETNLSLRTVRTIVGRERGTDRTSKARCKRIERIEIDKFQRATWKAQKRTGDALPKLVEAVIETGKALVTEAKGLGRGR